ncbi:hypothetical protein FF38_03602 [Lucilia cuprina]|uniref:Phospholipase A2 n=2 Tax=Lucilia cuprina TaxID=7375 RepID=A0A0L0CQ08_LUCCU|nr:hypothetical protein FF38_03406 [Lucilia cuprina]KNC34433.1 hypothetical protein FF38_03602 [Lucilia cuprina]
MIQTIKQDMHQAFCSITNNTRLLKQMYDFETANTDISTLLFKLPDSEESPETETLILMNRREFITPTFPNLTRSYMTLRRLKVAKAPLEENMTELLKLEMKNVVKDYVYDAWTDMGLDGWKGDIADSKIPIYHKYPTTIAKDYPHADIAKDLSKGESNDFFQDITTNTLKIEKDEQLKIQKEMDKNVYIARANDPFGYSTKWQTRNASNQNKYKRDVLRLYSMIKCSTGCEPLVYKGYGCYCGFLGDGIPTDGIDRCCKLHDKCYEYSNCISYLEYFVPYVWKCYRGKPLCAIDHGEWGGPQSCAARLCHCDLRLSRCLRQYACPGRRAVCRSSASRRLQNLLLTK